MTNMGVFRKGLVIGIIVLFVGVSVTPSISGVINQRSFVKNEKIESEINETRKATKRGIVNLPN